VKAGSFDSSFEVQYCTILHCTAHCTVIPPHYPVFMSLIQISSFVLHCSLAVSMHPTLLYSTLL
jgi:hypothetical protein